MLAAATIPQYPINNSNIITSDLYIRGCAISLSQHLISHNFNENTVEKNDSVTAARMVLSEAMLF